MKNFLLLLAFTWLCSCDPPPASIRPPSAQFRTTPPSRLYFKNMRSYYYEQSTDAPTKIDRYTLKKFRDASARPLLLPIIADNWLADEAYLFLEKDTSVMDSNTLLFQFEQDHAMDTLQLVKFDVENQYLLAKELYERLKKSHKIRIYTKNKIWQPLFKNQAEQAYYLRVMDDYYNLIEYDVN